MLFRGDPGQRLEPMGKVGCAMLDCPVLHRLRNGICHIGIEGRTLIDGLLERIVHLAGQGCLHHSVVKYETAEIIRYGFHLLYSLFCKNKNEAASPTAQALPMPRRDTIASFVYRFFEKRISVPETFQDALALCQ